MKSIDDDLEPPVPTPSTIRPGVKNKGKQCVFRSCLTCFLLFDHTVCRLLGRAVRFTAVLPFVNPTRAALSAVKLEGRKYVVQGVKGNNYEGVNVVFLTTGIVTECAIVKPASSWAPLGGPPGSPVRRVRLRPFAIEFERMVAFLGNFLDLEKTKSFNGPISNNGLGFSTRKEGARKGGYRMLSYCGMGDKL